MREFPRSTHRHKHTHDTRSRRTEGRYPLGITRGRTLRDDDEVVLLRVDEHLALDRADAHVRHVVRAVQLLDKLFRLCSKQQK